MEGLTKFDTVPYEAGAINFLSIYKLLEASCPAGLKAKFPDIIFALVGLLSLWGMVNVHRLYIAGEK